MMQDSHKMKDKERDKRLLIPKDEFGEEAAEGLGRLSREEAAEDLRELSGRLERRLEHRARRPRRIWLPAAAAVVTVLVASALYVSLFRSSGDREPAVAMADKKMADSLSAAVAAEAETDTALLAAAGQGGSDTFLIAMAAPIEKGDAAEGSVSRESMPRADRASEKAVTPPPPEETAVERAPLVAASDDEVLEVVVQAQHEEAAAEEVIVEALPMMQKAALRAEDAEKDKAAKKTEVASTAAATGTLKPDRSAGPVGGWEAFNDWTRPNISHAGEIMTTDNPLVVVAFRVRADSTLYDLKVVRSGAESYSREALRLLREGPKWIPAVREGQVVEEEVKVSIVFK